MDTDMFYGDVKIELKEEFIVENEANVIMEYEKNFIPMEVNVCSMKEDQNLPFDYKKNALDITENVISSNTLQKSAVNVHERIMLNEVIDNNNGDIIVIEHDKFLKEPTDKCNGQKCFENGNMDANLNQSTSNNECIVQSDLQNSNATILRHVDNIVSGNEKESIDITDGGEEEKALVEHSVSVCLIDDAKAECGDGGATLGDDVYQKLLGTSEVLRVSLICEDLVKLQKTFKEERCKRFHKPSTSKRFLCKSCPFTTHRRFDLLVHITNMHKDMAVEMKIQPIPNMFPGEEPNVVWYRCTDCVYVSRQKDCFVKHLLIHKQMHEVQTFSCALCSFVTKVKERLKIHMERHRTEPTVVLICPYCSAYFANKVYLKRHVKFLHKTDELEKLKCSQCSFKTVYKNSFRAHLITHDESRKLYKCPLCPFETPHKAVLRNSHRTLHQSNEARIFHCAHCMFKAKTRSNIINHLKIHKDPSQVKTYKCDKCSYHSIHRENYRRHQQVHKNIKELDLVPCLICPYQGRTKDHLRTHMTNRHPKEDKVYSCEYCSYQCRQKSYMKKHSVTHMAEEEIKFHYCDGCNYKAKTPYEVRNHFNKIHAAPPKEVKWHKCDQCDLKFIWPRALRRHMSCHKDSEKKNSADLKANLFYCYHCPYYTKQKRNLKSHLPMHTNVFLHCDKCNFHTRYRSCMLRHRITQH